MVLICVTAGRVLQTLPYGNAVCGVTLLDNLLYVLRDGLSSEQLEVYHKDSYHLQYRLTVSALDSPADIVACAHNRCAYISDGGGGAQCVRRLALPCAAVRSSWPVNDKPAGLSVSDLHSLLVTCPEVRLVKEFSTDGRLLRQVQLPEDVVVPCHTAQLTGARLAVCHGGYYDRAGRHRVCLIGSDGQVDKSFGGSCSSGTQQMNAPAHLAVDRNKFVFVADLGNDRVLLLSSSLTYMREVMSTDKLKGWPRRLCLDEDKNRLYVAVNDSEGGQVAVVSI